jgi:hypothetical protein
MCAKLDRRVVEGYDHHATFSQLLNEALEASRAAREVYRDAGMVQDEAELTDRTRPGRPSLQQRTCGDEGPSDKPGLLHRVARLRAAERVNAVMVNHHPIGAFNRKDGRPYQRGGGVFQPARAGVRVAEFFGLTQWIGCRPAPNL